MQLRRDKGLCYFCDEKFTFNHKCANKQLLMLMTKEEEIATHPEPEPPDPIQHAKEPNSSDHHLSLNALKGVTGIGNIRFTAQLHGSIIQVLADGGSSDNFVQPRIAKFLQLPMEPKPIFKVMVGNGSYMTTEGFIRDLNLQVQGVELHLSAFVLPICGADLIRGGKWLATLGLHMADYDRSQLKFLQNGKYVTLQGDPSLRPAQAGCHHL